MTTYTLRISSTGATLTGNSYPTGEEAAAVAATFTKASKMGVYQTVESATLTTPAKVTYRVEGSAGLAANGTNGGVNETGIKRLKSMFKTIEKAGDTIDLCPVWHHHETTSLEDFRTRYGI